MNFEYAETMTKQNITLFGCLSKEITRNSSFIYLD